MFFIGLFFKNGIKISEVCTLKFSDIEKENYIHIQRMWQRNTGRILDHTNTENKKPMIHRIISRLCEKYCKRLGVPTNERSQHTICSSAFKSALKKHMYIWQDVKRKYLTHYI